MNNTLKGGCCLCGEVQYIIEPHFQSFLYCFCSRCRKVTGSAHASNIYLHPKYFKWLSGQENVARYELPSKDSFSTCFCKTCGSPLPHATRSGQLIIIPVGSINDNLEHRPENSIFWSSKASWYRNPDETKKHDEYANE